MNINLQQVHGHLLTLKGRVRDQWEQLLVDETSKMESHRSALSSVAQSWSRDGAEAVESRIPESQPGLS